MIIISSPSKTLNFKVQSEVQTSEPLFLDKAEQVVNVLKKKSARSLQKLFDISKALGELNKQRFDDWTKVHNSKNSKPALYAYKGEVYRQIELGKYSKSELAYIQKNLRIITGLYGVLRPMDLIQEYRLMMGTPVKVGKSKNLYKFWSKEVNEYLNSELNKNNSKYLINLASDEYGAILDPEVITARIINIEFRYIKNGVMKNIGILAKKARGQMINYMVWNKVGDLEELKKFSVNGYKLLQEENNSLYFIKQL